MRLKEVKARIIKDSRNEKTIEVSVNSKLGLFSASSPSGKSKGRYEKPYYINNIEDDIKNLLADKERIFGIEIEKFSDLEKIENLLKNKIGSNTMIALEISILKALASEQGKQLWQVINPKAGKIPFPVGNCIGGGLHTPSTEGKKPDFQEFLIIPKSENFSDNVFLMNKAYDICRKELKARGALGKKNDENALSTSLGNEEVLEIMKKVKEELEYEIGKDISIGIDVASSSFFTGLIYNYKNEKRKLDKVKQINYILDLIDKYNLDYIEDPLEEKDFSGFSKLRYHTVRIRPTCLVVGDDLTASNLKRVEKAIKEDSINAVILKPNQIGSLIEIFRISELARKNSIKTIMSHRSGENLDNSLSDLAFAFQTDYIKTGILGKEREIKLKRMIEVEKSLKARFK